jgi:putative nucleotidyltransferase with HDIG domain
MPNETSTRVVDEKQVLGHQRAKELIGKLYVLIRSASTHDRNNALMRNSARSAHEALARLLEDCDSVRFDAVSDCIFFNSVRLRSDVASFKTFDFLIKQMKSVRVRAIILDEAADADDFLGFATVFARVNGKSDITPEDPFKELKRLLQLEGTAGIHLEEWKKDLEAFSESTALMGPTKEEARHSFFSALHIVKEAVKGGISRGSVNPRKVKRVVESVVDSILSNEESVLALTYIRDYDEFTYHHSLNVCVYSIALGNRLGMPKPALCEIGISALFHDIGKTYVPIRVLNQVGQLTDQDWRMVRRHTKTGVQILTQFKKLDRITMRAMMVAFCHHMNLDRTGYPETSRVVSPDTFSRIVRIADVYDALTGARPYRVKPFSRNQALEIIREKSGRELDPLICTVFEDVIGVIPEQKAATEADHKPESHAGKESAFPTGATR